MKRHQCFWILLFAASLTSSNAQLGAADFASQWSQAPDRVWIGPEYWANRLHDWRIQDGRLECVERRARYPM